MLPYKSYIEVCQNLFSSAMRRPVCKTTLQEIFSGQSWTLSAIHKSHPLSAYLLIRHEYLLIINTL